MTAALLRRDYGVRWVLPSGHLIPPVPGRANYIAWIADLLALSQPPGGSLCDSAVTHHHVLVLLKLVGLCATNWISCAFTRKVEISFHQFSRLVIVFIDCERNRYEAAPLFPPVFWPDNLQQPWNVTCVLTYLSAYKLFFPRAPYIG